MGDTLLGDIGGTNARFALLRAGSPGPALRLATADFPDLKAALADALAALGAGTVEAAAVCAAGPPEDGVIAMTNCPWEVSLAAIATVTGARQTLLLNDFAALAAALPALPPEGLQPLGGGPGRGQAPLAVIGPGTGLGVSAHLPGPGAGVQVAGEGGHADLPAGNAAEDRIIERLRERFGHVSAERVLSGPGLGALYRAMHPSPADAAPPSAERVAAEAAAGDAQALACVRQFCAFLGTVAGNVALTFGARGGLYLGGGILPAWGPLFQGAVFRERFEDKGRYRDYLSRIPTYMITDPQPALRGLARLLAHGEGSG
jgi:glucokinase